MEHTVLTKKDLRDFPLYVLMIIWRSFKKTFLFPAVTHNKRNPIQNFFETACKRRKGMTVPPPRKDQRHNRGLY